MGKYPNLMNENVVTTKKIRVFDDGSAVVINEGIVGKVTGEKMLRKGYAWEVDFGFITAYIDKLDFASMFELENDHGIIPMVEKEE